MKVNELIKKLQEIKEQNADIVISNLGNDDFIELGFIQDLELINNGNELDGNMFYVMVGVEFESTKEKGEK